MAFKPRAKSKLSVTSIESLFMDLRNRSVEGLLAHQADILRKYEAEMMDRKDVAIELPTGSGKTLVGLLIAEYRRLKLGERVVYLCPTRQLVKQVVEQSKSKYGITSIAFLGSRKEYSPADKSEYQTAGGVAVAAYSALFNTNPFFENAETIILDDAHAAENYIGSNWSLLINRYEHTELYSALLGLLKDGLSQTHYSNFTRDKVELVDLSWVEKIPSPAVQRSEHAIRGLLDAATEGMDLRHAWSTIRNHLYACHVYASYGSILIRPFIPPSLSHEAFAKANHRVYMSATLGRGGDLERITGIRDIHRLPIPAGWDKQGLGRRFFMFPESSLSGEDALQLTVNVLAHAPRAVVLVPDDRSADRFRTLIAQQTDHLVLGAADIEESKTPFTKQDKTVLVLANRYDGIDFNGDECRVLVLDGLPKAANLQERFLESRMAAGILLQDRIRTRIIQAIGRCTRSATDYSAVCVLGEDFSQWLSNKDKRSIFHPELQGELLFGIEQSRGQTIAGFLENLDIFLRHGDEWNHVDNDIVGYRDESVQRPIDGEQELLKAARHEVDYQYHLWNENYEAAVEAAQSALQHLTGDAVRGYRGFWYYLAGTAAALARDRQKKDAFALVSRDFFKKAASCTISVPWLQTLAAEKAETADAPTDYMLASNIENFETRLTQLGLGSTSRFERELKQISDGIQSKDAKKFEDAHKRLGEMLGYVCGNSDEEAAPDPWWVAAGKLCLVFEDKTDSKPENPVSATHARQAASHPNWIREKVVLEPDAEILPVLLTTATAISPGAVVHTGDLRYWHLDGFQKWALTAINTVRSLRMKFAGAGDLAWRADAISEFKSAGVDPVGLAASLRNNYAKDLPPTNG